MATDLTPAVIGIITGLAICLAVLIIVLFFFFCESKNKNKKHFTSDRRQIVSFADDVTQSNYRVVGAVNDSHLIPQRDDKYMSRSPSVQVTPVTQRQMYLPPTTDEHSRPTLEQNYWTRMHDDDDDLGLADNSEQFEPTNLYPGGGLQQSREVIHRTEPPPMRVPQQSRDLIHRAEPPPVRVLQQSRYLIHRADPSPIIVPQRQGELFHRTGSPLQRNTEPAPIYRVESPSHTRFPVRVRGESSHEVLSSFMPHVVNQPVPVMPCGPQPVLAPFLRQQLLPVYLPQQTPMMLPIYNAVTALAAQTAPSTEVLPEPTGHASGSQGTAILSGQMTFFASQPSRAVTYETQERRVLVSEPRS